MIWPELHARASSAARRCAISGRTSCSPLSTTRSVSHSPQACSIRVRAPLKPDYCRGCDELQLRFGDRELVALAVRPWPRCIPGVSTTQARRLTAPQTWFSLRPMRLSTIILQVLLCCSLVEAGYANAVVSAQCSRMSANGTATTLQHHHHHSATTRGMGHGADSMSEHCKCPMKCSCTHFCATGGTSVALTNVVPLRLDALSIRLTPAADGTVQTRLLTDVFRPPCLAQS